MYLDKLLESTKVRLEKKKKEISIQEMRKMAEQIENCKGENFEKNLKKQDISFICEVKKASPSKGIIVKNFPYLQIAKEYELAGAEAVSVLTEPQYFLGSDRYLSEISKNIEIPTLRKDFTIDEYQIHEAKALGAAAILLISEMLEKEKLREYLAIAKSIGLSVLTESHSLSQMEKSIAVGAKILGINNRNLETFEVTIENSIKLRYFVPSDCIVVSESGIQDGADIMRLKEHRIDAVLIGETLMRSKEKTAIISQWKGLK